LTPAGISIIGLKPIIDLLCRLVYDGVREIRRAVLLNRGREEDDEMSDTEWEGDQGSEVASQRPDSTTAEMVDEYPEISGKKLKSIYGIITLLNHRHYQR